MMPGQWLIRAFDGEGALAQQGADLAPGQTREGLLLEFRKPQLAAAAAYPDQDMETAVDGSSDPWPSVSLCASSPFWLSRA